MKPPSRPDPDSGHIRDLNDALRQHGIGGRVTLTSGVGPLGPSKVALIAKARGEAPARLPVRHTTRVRSANLRSHRGHIAPLGQF